MISQVKSERRYLWQNSFRRFEYDNEITDKRKFDCRPKSTKVFSRKFCSHLSQISTVKIKETGTETERREESERDRGTERARQTERAR